jgi:hypothetical protein
MSCPAAIATSGLREALSRRLRPDNAAIKWHASASSALSGCPEAVTLARFRDQFVVAQLAQQ